MNRLFGTDGVRGVAGSELTPELAFRLGRAGAYVLGKRTERPTIYVGKDTRQSGDMLECALVSGILAAGADAHLLGVLPTPGVAYMTKAHGAAAGAVISASHNPAKYNGIKFFSGDGFKLPDEIEDEIQLAMEKDTLPPLIGDAIGRSYRQADAASEYADFAISTFSGTLSGIRLLLDCANGAMSEVAPSAFRSLGASVSVLSAHPDGMNINKDCGSTHLEALSAAVKSGAFDLGIAFDGDGDRVLFTDENGDVIDGDAVMALCAGALHAEGALAADTLCATVMSNMGLDLYCRARGMRLLRTRVGDRYVLEEMQKGGYILGGEQSGHLIFSRFVTTGDGLVSALQFLRVLQKSGKSASALCTDIITLPQVLKNVRVYAPKEACLADETFKKEVLRIEKALGDTGRVLIRPSGTEPRIRIMLEGDDRTYLEEEAALLADILTERYGRK